MGMSEHLAFYQQELGAIRRSADEFSSAYPNVAAELKLSAGHSADPHVEQLLQSFAWLTSRLRRDLDQQRYEIPNHVLLSLYPNILRSIPCMSVLQANVMPDGANFVNGYSLQKGRLFSTQSVSRRSADGTEGRSVDCRMQCCYDTPLWPLAIEDVAVKPKNAFEFLDQRADVQAVISVAIKSQGTDPIYEYPLDKLRFFIADPLLRPKLYQLLNDNLCGIAIKSGDQIIPLHKGSIEWLGFDKHHNVLPQPESLHSGYRLLQEYFYFPEKFYFFDIAGLQLDNVVDEFELLLLLDQADNLTTLKPETLSINSFPVINLFPASFKPIQLDYSQYEYRLLADESQYGQSEVHSVEEVRVLSANGEVRLVSPWVGKEASLHAYETGETACDLRYVSRLTEPLLPKTPGCDTMLSLYDAQLSPGQPVDQTISAKGLCSNRNLPESLHVGNKLKLVGTGAIMDATVVSHPTLFKGARLAGDNMVKLLSQLHLNHASLVENFQGERSVENLRRILHIHSDSLTPSHQRQIQGIVELKARPSVRRIGADAWRGHFRGTCMTMIIEEDFFDGANPMLLGEVISHFLGLYTTMNHFVQLHLCSYQREGIWKQWPPRIGEQVIL
jgi:type VI secretion system protein ImpG